MQSSDEGIGTTLSDDTVDVEELPVSEGRWTFIEIEPDWDRDIHWRQKTWENSITRYIRIYDKATVLEISRPLAIF